MPGHELVPEQQQTEDDAVGSYPLAHISPPSTRHPLSLSSFTTADILVGGSLGVLAGVIILGLFMWMPLMVLLLGPVTLATFSLGILIEQRARDTATTLAGGDRTRQLTDPHRCAQHWVEVAGDRGQTTLRLVRIDLRDTNAQMHVRSVLEEVTFIDTDSESLEAAVETKLRFNQECDRLNHESRNDHLICIRRDEEMKEFRQMLKDIE